MLPAGPAKAGASETPGVILALRVRPENDAERKDGKSSIAIIGNRERKRVEILDQSSLSSSVSSQALFAADCVFPSDATQEEVYKQLASIQTTIFEGFSSTLLAYGQTGSGKSYSLTGGLKPEELLSILNGTIDINAVLSKEGNNGGSESGGEGTPSGLPPLSQRLGLVPRLLNGIWSEVELNGGETITPPGFFSEGAESEDDEEDEEEGAEQGQGGVEEGKKKRRFTFTFSISLVEVYNEQIRDLLLPASEQATCLPDVLSSLNSKAKVELEREGGPPLVLFDGEKKFSRLNPQSADSFVAGAAAVTSARLASEAIAEEVGAAADDSEEAHEEKDDDAASVTSSDLLHHLATNDASSSGGVTAGHARRGGASIGVSLSSSASIVSDVSASTFGSPLVSSAGGLRGKGKAARPSIGGNSLRSANSFTGRASTAGGRRSLLIAPSASASASSSSSTAANIPPPRIRATGGTTSQQQQSFELLGAVKVVPSSLADIFAVLAYGESQRSKASTNMNDSSSRSHSVFQLRMRRTATNGVSYVSTLNLVDLAGSESVSKTGASGQQFEELKKINQSLSTLSRVIEALSMKKKPPFRESQLTMILADSFSGRSRIALLVCLSPSSVNKDESVRSLRFGETVKRIPVHAQVDVVLPPAMSKLVDENRNLQQKISQLSKELAVALAGGRAALAASDDTDRVEEDRKRRERAEALEAEIRALKDQQDHLRLQLRDLEQANRLSVEASRKQGTSAALLSLTRVLKRGEAALLQAASVASPATPSAAGLSLVSTFSALSSGSDAEGQAAPPSPFALQSPPVSARTAATPVDEEAAGRSRSSSSSSSSSSSVPLSSSSSVVPATPAGAVVSLRSPMSPGAAARLLMSKSSVSSPSTLFRGILQQMHVSEEKRQDNDDSALFVALGDAFQETLVADGGETDAEEQREERLMIVSALESLLTRTWSLAWKASAQEASRRVFQPLLEQNREVQQAVRELKRELLSRERQTSLLKTELSGQIEQETKARKQAQTALEEATKKHDAAAAEAAALVASLRAQLQAAADDIAAFPERLAKAVSDELDRQQQEEERKALAAASCFAAELQAAQSAFAAESDELAGRLASVQKLVEGLRQEGVNSQLAHAQQVAQLNASFEEAQKASLKTIGELQSSVTDYKERLEAAAQTGASLHGRLAEAEASAHALEDKARSLTADLMAKEEQHAAASLAATARFDALQLRSESEKAELGRRVDDLRGRLAAEEERFAMAQEASRRELASSGDAIEALCREKGSLSTLLTERSRLLEETRSSLSSVAASLEETKVRLASAEREVLVERGNADSLAALLHKAEDELVALRSVDLPRALERIKQSEGKSVTLQVLLEQQKEQSKAVSARVEELTSLLTTANAALASREERVATLERDMGRTMASSSDLSSERQVLMLQLNELRAEAASLQAQTESLSGDKAKLTERVTRLEEEVSQREAGASARDASEEATKAELSSIAEKARLLASQLELAQNRLANAQGEVARLKEELRASLEKGEKVAADFAVRESRLHGEITLASDRAASANLMIERLTAAAEETSRRHEDELASARESAHEANRAHDAALQQQKDAHAAAVASLEAERESFDRALLEAKAEGARQHASLVALREETSAQLASLAADASKKEKQLQEQADKLKETSALLDGARDELAALRADLEASRGQRSAEAVAFQETNSGLAARVTSLEGQTTSLRAQLEDSTAALASARIELDSSLSMLEAAERAKAALASAHQESIASLISRHEEAAEALTMGGNALQDRITQLEEQIRLQTKGLAEARSAAASREAGLEAAIDQQNALLARLHEDKGDTDARLLQLLHIALPEAKARAEEAEKEAASLSAELGDRAAELESLRSELDASTTSFAALRLEREAAELERKELQAKVVTLLSEVEAQNRKLLEAAEGLEAARQDHQEEVLRIVAEKEQGAVMADEAIAGLRSELAAARSALAAMTETTSGEKSALTSALTEQRNRCEAAERRVALLESVRDAQEDQIEALEAERDSLLVKANAQESLRRLGSSVFEVQGEGATAAAAVPSSGSFLSAVANFAGSLSRRGSLGSQAASAVTGADDSDSSRSSSSSAAASTSASCGPVPPGTSKQALWESLHSLVQQIEGISSKLHEMQRARSRLMDDLVTKASQSVSLEIALASSRDREDGLMKRLQETQKEVANLQKELEKKGRELGLSKLVLRSPKASTPAFAHDAGGSATASFDADADERGNAEEGEGPLTGVMSLFRFITPQTSGKKAKKNASSTRAPSSSSLPQPLFEEKVPEGRAPLSPVPRAISAVVASGGKASIPAPAASTGKVVASTSSSPSENSGSCSS